MSRIRKLLKEVLTPTFLALVAAFITVGYQYYEYKQEQEEIITRTLRAIYEEIKTSYCLYQETTSVEIKNLEEVHKNFKKQGIPIPPITLYFTVINDFFPVYIGNSSFLGYLDNKVSSKIIKGYALAYSMAKDLRYHDILFDKSENHRDIYDSKKPNETYKKRWEAYRQLVIDHQTRLIERNKEFEREIKELLIELEEEINTREKIGTGDGLNTKCKPKISASLR